MSNFYDTKFSEGFVQEAEVNAKAFNRHLNQQIEYWAKVGKIASENQDLNYKFIKALVLGIERSRAKVIYNYKFGVEEYLNNSDVYTPKERLEENLNSTVTEEMVSNKSNAEFSKVEEDSYFIEEEKVSNEAVEDSIDETIEQHTVENIEETKKEDDNWGTEENAKLNNNDILDTSLFKIIK